MFSLSFSEIFVKLANFRLSGVFCNNPSSPAPAGAVFQDPRAVRPGPRGDTSRYRLPVLLAAHVAGTADDGQNLGSYERLRTGIR